MNNSVPENLRPVYFQNLDASRFIAAFAVFIFHFSNELKGLFPALSENNVFQVFHLFAGKGGLGVNFFFVLSGFLITYLILNERKRTGTFHLGKFLVRRTLRIWPLYFIIIFIGFVLFPYIFSDYATDHKAINFVFFLANFDEIWYGANDSINFLTSPWSVAVEEQFYLFWGIVLFLLFKVKKFKLEYLLIFMYLVSFYFRWYYWQDERTLYYHTLTVCQDILTGSFIGWSLSQKKRWLEHVKKIPRVAVLSIYLIGIFLCIAKNKLFLGELIILERSVLSLFFAFIILDQIRGEFSLFKLGKISVFNYFGKISYGIYMYHLVVMFVLLKFVPETQFSTLSFTLLFLFGSFGITILVSALSYHLIESKFLSLKPKH